MSIKYVETKDNMPLGYDIESLSEFIYTNMGIYSDTKSAIIKAIEYSLSDNPDKGGGILFAHDEKDLIGVIVINRSGMSEYIPEYFLVYVVVAICHQSKGIGTKLLNQAIKICNGDIALHVEYDNPAKNIYEKLGFKNKYAEMRREKLSCQR